MPDYTTKMSYEKAEEARRLFREGKSISYLCDHFGLSRRAMEYLIKGESWRQKEPEPSNKKPKTKNAKSSRKVNSSNKWDSVYTLLCEGKSNKEIAAALHITVNYVSFISWAINCARKDPSWVDTKKNSKTHRIAEWADKKVKSEITNEDWKAVSFQLSDELREERKHVSFGAILRLFDGDVIQVHFEGSKEDWEDATELPANSPFMKPFLTYRVKEADIVPSKFSDMYVLRVGIVDHEEGET